MKSLFFWFFEFFKDLSFPQGCGKVFSPLSPDVISIGLGGCPGLPLCATLRSVHFRLTFDR